MLCVAGPATSHTYSFALRWMQVTEKRVPEPRCITLYVAAVGQPRTGPSAEGIVVLARASRKQVVAWSVRSLPHDATASVLATRRASLPYAPFTRGCSAPIRATGGTLTKASAERATFIVSTPRQKMRRTAQDGTKARSYSAAK